jgi:hypothetical protein
MTIAIVATKNEYSSAGLSTEIFPLHSVQGQNDTIRDRPFDRLRANGH